MVHSRSGQEANAVGNGRWSALCALCLGVIMIIIDGTVLAVALPSLKQSLKFSPVSLVWVVNAYMLTYGGFLLLGGRIGDKFGQRRMFLWGIALFMLASICCGLSTSREFLIAMRALQGVGGALSTAVALALITTLFSDPHDRAKAMGIYGFVCNAGGGLGLLLGGVLTTAFGWRSAFFVNIPIGITVYMWSFMALPASGKSAVSGRFDVSGALTMTLFSAVAVYAVVSESGSDWRSGRTMVLLGCAGALLTLFIFIEAHARSPLVPLGAIGRNLAVANVIIALWSAAEFAWFFLMALYLQLVLGCTPRQIGLIFLPANLLTAALSIGISAKLVKRLGMKVPSVVGMLTASAGFALFARMPVRGDVAVDVFPGMLLVGLGAGVFSNALLLVAMSDVPESESGLASGLLSTTALIGGVLGLATLASVADARSRALLAVGEILSTSLTSGYHIAFVMASILTALAALTGAAFLRGRPKQLPAIAVVSAASPSE